MQVLFGTSQAVSGAKSVTPFAKHQTAFANTKVLSPVTVNMPWAGAYKNKHCSNRHLLHNRPHTIDKESLIH